MLSLRMASSGRLAPSFTRAFAEVVNDAATRSTQSSTSGRRRREPKAKSESNDEEKDPRASRVPVREDHGLYSFFRRKPGADLVGEEQFETVETPEDGRLITGRAWEAAELRLKSFKDLHTLWYVAAREQNLLATQKEEVRRMGVTNPEMQGSIERVRHCRKTMARIKAVLNERRLAYEGAVKLAQEQSDYAHTRAADEENRKILEFQVAQEQVEAPKAKRYRAVRRDLVENRKGVSENAPPSPELTGP